MTTAAKELAFAYAKGSAMLAKYLELNGYSRIVVQKHHLGEPGWQVWMMTGESSGNYEVFPTRKAAQAHAAELSSHTGLPIAAA